MRAAVRSQSVVFPLAGQEKPPAGTGVIITNTWNGFALHRPVAFNVTVERLFVLGAAHLSYKTRLE